MRRCRCGRPAELPDRDSGSRRKVVCKSCHADKLRGDLQNLLKRRPHPAVERGVTTEDSTMARESKSMVARRAASFKANRLADAIRYLNAAAAEADAAGLSIDTSGAIRDARAQLAVHAAESGFDVAEYLGEDA